MKTTIQIVAAFLSVAALADSQGASGQKAPVYRSSFDGSWRFQKVDTHVEVLGEDTFHGVPAGENITCGTP